LIAKHPSASEDDYDVFADGIVVGRIMRAIVAPVGSPWFWTGHGDRQMLDRPQGGELLEAGGTWCVLICRRFMTVFRQNAREKAYWRRQHVRPVEW